MADTNDWSSKDDMGIFAELVALFGVKRGSDWFFVWNIIKLIFIIIFLAYCLCH